MIRVCAGMSYALTEAMDEGHCGLPTEELLPLAVKLLEVRGELLLGGGGACGGLEGGEAEADRLQALTSVFPPANSVILISRRRGIPGVGKLLALFSSGDWNAVKWLGPSTMTMRPSPFGSEPELQPFGGSS
jgi:hypothetical protein